MHATPPTKRATHRGSLGPWALPMATGLSSFWQRRMDLLPATACCQRASVWVLGLIAVCATTVIGLPTLVAGDQSVPAPSAAPQPAAPPSRDDTTDEPAPQENIDPSRSIHVLATVVDAASGEPIEAFHLVAAARDHNEKTVTWQSQWQRQFAAGAMDWQFDRAWEQMVFRIDADGYRPFVSQMIKRGEELEMAIKLERDRGIAARVRTPLGGPARAAQVVLCTNTNEVSVEGGTLRHCGHGEKLGTQVRTSDDGSFRLPPEVDPWVIVVAHQTGYAEVTAEELARNDTIDLQAWGRIEGQLSAAGKPIAGQWIHVGAGRGDVDVHLGYSAEVQSDDEGRFVVERVPPVSLYVQPMFKRGETTWNMNWFAGRTKIAAGRTTHIDLPRPGRAIMGQIVLPEGSQLTAAEFVWDVSIALRPPSLSMRSPQEMQEVYAAYGEFVATDLGRMFGRGKIPVDDQGRFEVDGLPENTYVVSIRGVEKPELVAPGAAAKTVSLGQRVEIPPRDGVGLPLDVGNCAVRLQDQKQ